MKRFSFIFVYIAAFSLTFVSCKNDSSSEKNKDKASNKLIVETGELAAIRSNAIPMERFGRHWYEMRVIGILPHGSIIQKGDSIIQLDPVDIKKSIIEWEDDLETQYATQEKLKVDQDIRRNDMLSNIKSEEASFELKKLELEASRFESDRYKKIKQLEFRQAEIRLAKEHRKIELYDIISKRDTKIQNIRVQQLKNKIENAYSTISRLTIRSTTSGVFQIAFNQRTQAPIKIGDNVYAGNNMASVPDLSSMKVNTFVNENDFLYIHKGQKVIVRLDALPSVEFEGEVSYIGKLCRRKDFNSKQKVFDVEIIIANSDERLKPGMTVSCEYIN
ncbi:HlyD family secretion protein [Dysgonomonadaceae bacterium PH5-43]|nr:HlyD family secretion protein [Dysgonomonadaceae bacterium PH5-43]